MTGWSKRVDGSSLDYLEVLQKTKLCIDLGIGSKAASAEDEGVRVAFEEKLSGVLKAIYGKDCFRPLPPMLENGEVVNLLKLFLIVREKGGYERVSKKEVWDSVAVESGLCSGVGSAVKIVYAQYLDALNLLLERGTREKDSEEDSLQDSAKDLSGGSMGPDNEDRGANSEISDNRKRNRDASPLGVLGKSATELMSSYDNGDFVELGGVGKSGDMKKTATDDKNNLYPERSGCTEDAPRRKRKRESDQAMLDWLAEVAKDPCNPNVEPLPEKATWKSYAQELSWKQVLSTRRALFLKRNGNLGFEQSVTNWLKQKMHPFMYDDHAGSERSRLRRLALKEPRPSPLAAGSDVEESRNSSEKSGEELFSCKGYKRKKIHTGSQYQADVPEWNGETYESETRWLGSKVWPLESGEHNKFLIERERIGKGRQDSCGCQNAGSVECIRFHVSEKRLRVKLEVGSAFHRWKFDKMGEEVALSWTKDERRRFHAIIKANPPSSERCFWNELFNCFPSKSREDLVSYYFNVFLIERRGQQNRSSPINIDSDDEQLEYGILANRFGREAVKSPGSIFRSPKKPNLNSR